MARFQIASQPAPYLNPGGCLALGMEFLDKIVETVLQLLERLRPVAFVTTHFLDFSRRLESERPVSHLRFLQVELDQSQRSTYQFVPGVAETSLAANTAKRLGVTFEELSTLVDRSGGEG